MTSKQKCYQCSAAIKNPAASPKVTLQNGTEAVACCTGCQQTAQTLENLKNQHHKHHTNWSDYDHPKVLREIAAQINASTDYEITLIAKNIHCSACVFKIEQAFKDFQGIIELQVNVTTGRIYIVWDNSHIQLSRILQLLDELGHPSAPLSNLTVDDNNENRQALKRLIVAGFGMMQVMMYAVGLYAGMFHGISDNMQLFLHLVSLLVTTPVVFYSGKPFFQRAFSDMHNRQLSMDVPVALAISIAYFASVWAVLTQQETVYFDSVTMFIFLLSLGRYAEMKARHQASASSDALATLTPSIAKRINHQREEIVPVSELELGDILLIKPGETIPADGTIIEGVSHIDESLLTGEFTPQLKAINDSVTGGSINHNGILKIRVEKLGQDSTLSHIARLVERAQMEKPRISQLADRIAGYFVATVIVCALVTGIIWWFMAPDRALPIVLSMLVVTCPCALSLATPATLTVAIGRLAKESLLVAHSNSIEALAKTTHMLFDKTGTLTYGQLKLQKINTLGALTETECLKLAASLEQYSEHPIAKTFHLYNSVPATAVKNIPGAGLEGLIDGRKYRIGVPEFVAELNPMGSEQFTQLTTDGVILLGDTEQLLAAFELADTMRPATQSAFQQLRSEGLTLEIISGDQAQAVQHLAQQLQCKSQYRQTPDNKLAYIRQLQQQGHKVAMVGDGVNDAPVLAGADISIAMASGTTLAQTSADMVLMRDNLQTLPTAVAIARQSLRVIRQNISWAIGYNIAALPLAAMGLIPPWLAAIGMSSSSLLVVLNALRLKRFALKPEDYPQYRSPKEAHV